MDKISPQFGPVSGGTALTLYGQYLSSGSFPSVRLEGIPCTINPYRTTSDTITCITPKGLKPGLVKNLTLQIDSAQRSLSLAYHYVMDPTVTGISPLKSISSGGRMIQVQGTGFNSVANPRIVVYSENSKTPINDTVS